MNEYKCYFIKDDGSSAMLRVMAESEDKAKNTARDIVPYELVSCEVVKNGN